MLHTEMGLKWRRNEIAPVTIQGRAESCFDQANLVSIKNVVGDVPKQ
jgi:hypothetical protein